MKIVIYKITNKINNKVYIGQTINYKERVRQHKEIPFRNNSKEKDKSLYKAIKKYGLNNFTFEIIDETDNFESSNMLEIYYISKYNSCVDNGMGYNLDLGGKNGNKSEATKLKISLAHKGYGGGSFGKLKGESYRARKVICLENNKIYDSIIECAEDVFGENYSRTDRIKISVCANPNSNRFTHKGYSFRYIDVDGKIIPKIVQKGSLSKYNRGMKIIEINTKKVFKSISDASKYFDISTSMIRDRVYKRVKDDKFIFMNYEDFIANGGVLTDNADDNTVPSLIEQEGVETTEKVSETIISESN